MTVLLVFVRFGGSASICIYVSHSVHSLRVRCMHQSGQGANIFRLVDNASTRLLFMLVLVGFVRGVESVSEWFRVVRSVSDCFRLVHFVWFRLVQSGSEWFRVVQSGSDWLV